jgi:RND family efflux transporter MFP subunit
MPRPRLATIIALSILALIFLALPLLRLAFKPSKEDGGAEYAPVVLAKVETRDMEDILSYSGILKPESTITILPKIAGRVERLAVREGAYVRKNDLIAVIDDEVAALQVEQARAGWEAAQAQADKARRGVRPQELENAKSTLAQAEKDVEAAESNFARMERLFQAGTVSKSKYEEAQNALQSAKTQLENARRSVSLMEEGASREDQEMAIAQANAMKAQYDLALLQAGYARVLAPASGRVVKVMAEAGNMVAQSTPLAVIASDTSMTAQVAVPERHFGRFIEHAGEIPVKVSPIAFPGRPPFEGLVTSVAQAVDPQSRSFVVEVSVDNASGLLRSGMYVNVAMVLERIPGALCVPDEAVLRRGGETIIFTFEAGEDGLGTAHRIKASTGFSSGGWTRILSGLDVGDSVIIEGGAFLEDGQKVRAVAGE